MGFAVDPKLGVIESHEFRAFCIALRVSAVRVNVEMRRSPVRNECVAVAVPLGGEFTFDCCAVET